MNRSVAMNRSAAMNWRAAMNRSAAINSVKYVQHTQTADWELGLTTNRSVRERMFTEVMHK